MECLSRQRVRTQATCCLAAWQRRSRMERSIVALAGIRNSFRRRQADAQRIGPIGIDFALEAVHLVQLAQRTGGTPALHATASVPYGCTREAVLSQPFTFRTLIKKARRSANFHGRDTVLAVPSGMYRTMSVNYQSTNASANDDAAVVKAVSQRLDDDLASKVIDYVRVQGRSRTDEKLALVAISDKQDTIELLETSRKANLDVTALEIGPVAIGRLVSAIDRNNEGSNTLVINAGRRSSFLTLISRGDLLLDQKVTFGEFALVKHVATALDMTESMARDLIATTGLARSDQQRDIDQLIEEAGLAATIAEILKPQFVSLAQEIKRLFLYAAAETRGGSVSQVFLLGSIAHWPGSDILLSSVVGSRVRTITDPLTEFALPQDTRYAGRNKSAPEIAVATGAALRGLAVP